MIRKGLFRFSSILMVLVLAIGILSGCGTGKDTAKNEGTSKMEDKQEGSQAAEAEKKDVTITLTASQNWIKDIDRQIAEEFTKETGIKVDIQVNPDDQYSNIVKSKFAAGEGPDIFMSQSGASLYDYFPEKNMLDLSNEPWVARLKDWAKNGATLDGKLYALNLWTVDGWGMLYNPDLFAKYNVSVPKTYDDFVKACETLKANGIQPIFQNTKDAWHDALWLNTVSYQISKANPDIYSKLNKGEAKFADIKELETTLTQINNLAQKGFFGKDYMSDTWDKGYEAIGSGKVAMIQVYTTYPNEIVAKYPQAGADKWKMFPCPFAGNKSFAVNSGGVVRCVNKNSKNIDSVKEYFNYITKAENVKKFYQGRPELGDTSFKDVDGKLTEAYRSVTSAEMSPDGMGVDFQGAVKYFDILKISKLMQEMYLGGKTPKQVLEAIDSDREKMIKAAAK